MESPGDSKLPERVSAEVVQEQFLKMRCELQAEFLLNLRAEAEYIQAEVTSQMKVVEDSVAVVAQNVVGLRANQWEGHFSSLFKDVVEVRSQLEALSARVSELAQQRGPETHNLAAFDEMRSDESRDGWATPGQEFEDSLCQKFKANHDAYSADIDDRIKSMFAKFAINPTPSCRMTSAAPSPKGFYGQSVLTPKASYSQETPLHLLPPAVLHRHSLRQSLPEQQEALPVSLQRTPPIAQPLDLPPPIAQLVQPETPALQHTLPSPQVGKALRSVDDHIKKLFDVPVIPMSTSGSPTLSRSSSLASCPEVPLRGSQKSDPETTDGDTSQSLYSWPTTRSALDVKPP